MREKPPLSFFAGESKAIKNKKTTGRKASEMRKTDKKTSLNGIWTSASRFAVAGFFGSAFSLFAFATTASAQSVGNLDTPTGGTVVGGSATISSPGAGQLNIQQDSSRAVIEWNSFNIGADATTEFFQPDANSLAVNRVTGGSADPTQILGTLKANGRVMVLDPNGVIVGNGAIVDVGGLVASTGSVSTADVMSGSQTLTLQNVDTGGRVVNNGTITAREGGLVALVAPNSVNNGVIQARLGRVEMVAGDQVTIDLFGDRLVEIAVGGTVASALVENNGQINADGGRVAMTARAAGSLVDSVINMNGFVQAQSVGTAGGKIILSGGTMTIGGNLDTTGQTAGTKGGDITLDGKNITIKSGTVLDASGDTGGGRVLVGGDVMGPGGTISGANSVTLESGAEIRSNAYRSGDGGTVVLWSDTYTEFSGHAAARGGAESGNGGFIEVSGQKGLLLNGYGDATAANGAMGTFLIDPEILYVHNGASSTVDNTNYLNAGSLALQLSLASVRLLADTEIGIIEAVDLSSSAFGTTTGNLTLVAPTVNINNDITMGTGWFGVEANELNLAGKIYEAGGALRNTAGFNAISLSPSTVNVMGDTASIQQGLDMTGDAPVTVNVAAGVYAENLVIHKSATINGVDTPILSGIAAGGTIFTVDADNVTITGFHFDGTGSASGVISSGFNGLSVTNSYFEGFSATGLSVTGGSNHSVSGNSFTNTGSYGVALDGADGASVDNNTFFADGAGAFGTGLDAVYVQNSNNVTVQDNAIFGENGGAGSMGSGIVFVNVTNSVIDNNLISGDGTGSFGAAQDGVRVDGSDNISVTNNEVEALNGGDGAGQENYLISADSTNITFENNLPVPPTDGGDGGDGGDDGDTCNNDNHNHGKGKGHNDHGNGHGYGHHKDKHKRVKSVLLKVISLLEKIFAKLDAHHNNQPGNGNNGNNNGNAGNNTPDPGNGHAGNGGNNNGNAGNTPHNQPPVISHEQIKAIHQAVAQVLHVFFHKMHHAAPAHHAPQKHAYHGKTKQHGGKYGSHKDNKGKHSKKQHKRK
jgi:filamentous hemagglutinin family protein